ncbi:MAG: polyphosphate kinase 2 family protein [Bacteroidetes bacterium]|nr:polyphosphate kinase 2 family protein [Bacteroidota bacterium]
MLNDPRILATPGSKISLKDYDTKYTAGLSSPDEAHEMRLENISKLKKLQEKLYAHRQHAILIIFQAMDAAGKDGTIKHVMSGINPQGCQVFSFKQPSAEELDHDYLWRCYKALPERGRIGIFNRSYYEEVLVAKIHPEIILRNRIPQIKELSDIDDSFWEQRYQQINGFEKHLIENGTTIIKFFLHLSKEEQGLRFLKRIKDKRRNWKFSKYDMKERSHWDDYQEAFESCINRTSTELAPWYIIPADAKWVMRTIVSEIITEYIAVLDPQFPTVKEEEQEFLQTAKHQLEDELG